MLMIYILLMKPIRGFNDFIHLQRDIDTIANCIDNLRLSLNTSKCKYIIVSRKKQPTIPLMGLHLNNDILEQVTSYRYLGVLISQRLSWSEHIQQICRKGRRLVGMLYRKFYKWADPAVRRSIYI